MDPKNEFIATGGSPKYQFKIGKHIATSLSGFIAGAITASVVWLAVAYVVNVLN